MTRPYLSAIFIIAIHCIPALAQMPSTSDEDSDRQDCRAEALASGISEPDLDEYIEDCLKALHDFGLTVTE